MADNYFDRYDAAPAAAPVATDAQAAEPTSAAPNYFDKYDEAPKAASSAAPAEKPSTWTGMGKQVLAGAGDAALGLADLGQMLNPGTGVARTLLPLIGARAQPLPSEEIKKVLPEAVNPDAYVPQGGAERVARAAGAGAASMLIPEATISRLGLLGEGTAKAAAPILGSGTIPSMVANTAKGAVAGAGGAGLEEVAPDSLKPAAGVVGGLTAGLLAEVPGLAMRGAGAAAKAVPLTQAQIDRTALDKIYGAAEDPAALRAAAEAGKPAEIIPGFQGTLGQETGDKGILGLETAVSRTGDNPPLFTAKREEQALAQRGAVTALQPGGDPAAVGDFFRSQLNDLDQQHALAVAAATKAAHGSVEAETLAGQRAIEGATTSGQHAIETATDAARGAALGIGAAVNPEAIGGQMRGAVEASLAAFKERERALWGAVPKDVSVVSSPLKQTAGRVYGTMAPEVASTLTPIERDVQGFIGGYGDTLPFDRLNGLRQIVNQGMKEARSPLAPNEAAYARLSQVRGAVEDAIGASLTKRAAEEQTAVASGAMRPEDAMVAKLRQEQNDWVAKNRSDTGARAETGTGGYGSSGSTSFSSAPGAKGQGRGKPGVPPGDTGVQGAGVPLIDEAGAAAIKAANAATKSRKELMGAGPIPAVMQKPFATSPYKLGDALVPGKIWRAGPEGAQAMTQFLAAAQHSPEAIEALSQAAANSLQTRMKNGILTDKAFEAWRGQHKDALRTLEAVKPGTAAKYQTAATAGKAIEDITAATAQRVKDTTTAAAAKLKETKAAADESVATAAKAHKDAVDGYQRSALGSILKAEDPADIAKAVGSALGSVDKMRAIVKEAAKNPAAMEGLRKSVADFIDKQFISNTEVGTSGATGVKADAFQSFVRKNRDALRLAMTPEQMQNLDAIAQSMMIAKRANATILPGQSATTQLISSAAHHGSPGSMWNTILGGLTSHAATAIGTGGAGFLAGGPLGAAAAAAAGEVLRALRSKGYAKADEIVRDALLNPDLFRALNQRVPQSKGAMIPFVNRVLRAAAAGEAGASEPQPRATGGRVHAAIEKAAAQTDPEPSDHAKRTGNYDKGTVDVHGLPIVIETPKGAMRTGKDSKGKPWAVKMPAHYGEFEGTRGADRDPVDVYLGPNPHSPKAWIVDQKDHRTGQFDEHKVMLGFSSKGHALLTYRAGFSDGKGGARQGAVTEMTMPELKEWLNSKETRKPAASAA